MAERATELRRDIEETRERMTGTVDAIGDRVSPGRVLERRMSSVREAGVRVRHTVMGVPRQKVHDARDATASGASSLGDAVSGVGDRASSVASTVGDQVTGAPQRITEGTQGNPLAAGAVAFGLGVLLGSLAPPSREERQLAERALPVIQDEAKAVGQAVAGTARDQAQQAVEETKAAATEAVDAVKERATDAAGTVQDQAADARSEVQDRAATAKDNVADQVADGRDRISGP